MDVIASIELVDKPVERPAMRYYADGTSVPLVGAVQAESLLDVYVNDILTMKLVCSACSLVELVVGRLFTEGMISAADEIDCLSVCENAMRADVYLLDRTADVSRNNVQEVATCCTNNRNLNDFFGTGAPLEPLSCASWEPEWVFRVAREFAQDKTTHAVTRGVHSAYLATREKTLCVMEDLGRHNAFDKAVGWGLLNGVDMSECLLFTSGRVPTDMVTKAVRSRIPILVSKAVPTDKTIEIAREYGLVLICSAKPDSIDVMVDLKRTSFVSRARLCEAV